jgi:hypothetical protein
MQFTKSRLRAFLLLSALSCLESLALAQPAPAPTGTQLSDEAELRRAQAFYDAGKYVECVKEFDGLLGTPPKLKDPSVLDSARVYYAACLIAVGKNDKAEEQFRLGLRGNPRLDVNQLIFPQVVFEVFNKVRGQMSEELEKTRAAEFAQLQAEAAAKAAREEAERRRVQRLEEIARRETIVSRNDRWLAAVPFGVGQFQNREPALGWIFLGTEIALAGTALGSLIVESSLNGKADDNLSAAETRELNTKVDTAHQVFVVSSWGFIGVGVLGIVQAQLAYVPEFRSTRMRSLPPDLRRSEEPPPKTTSRIRPSIRPGAIPTRNGFQLGVTGSF